MAELVENADKPVFAYDGILPPVQGIGKPVVKVGLEAVDGLAQGRRKPFQRLGTQVFLQLPLKNGDTR